MKYVRIDERTVILVRSTMTDEEASHRYLMRNRPFERPRRDAAYPLTPEECVKDPEVIPVEDIGELESMEEDEE